MAGGSVSEPVSGNVDLWELLQGDFSSGALSLPHLRKRLNERGKRSSWTA
jgi:hypothetical protein